MGVVVEIDSRLPRDVRIKRRRRVVRDLLDRATDLAARLKEEAKNTPGPAKGR